MNVKEYIESNWENTTRFFTENNDTLIGLPYPYTVPCCEGAFQEMYYWDVYFTNIGLIKSGRLLQAKNNVDNMCYLINKYGFMPNGNMTIYLNRSQPPFLFLMVKDVYDFFRDKLMFPIFNANGKIVAFSGRSLDGSEPKYINTSDTDIFHKRKTVFGLNFARDAIHRANRSIIVEGQIDAIKMQENGFPETVAPLGTALTEDHVAILCKSNRNIVFCFDGDNAGQKAAIRACTLVLPFLRDNSDVKFAFVSGGKDPDEILKTGGIDDDSSNDVVKGYKYKGEGDVHAVLDGEVIENE